MEIKLKLKGVETGEIALCSPKHFETLNKFNWWSNSDDYPETSWKNGKGGKITMHMYVVNIIEGLETPKGYFIDHDNKIRTDCRLENLRFLTRGQNSRNKRKKEDASSKMYGVKLEKRSKKYQVSFVYKCNTIYLGSYEIEEDAAIAYDTYIYQKDLVKEGYSLNFPDRKEFYKTNPIYKPKERKYTYYGVTRDKYNYYHVKITQNHNVIFKFVSINEKECAEKYDEFVVSNNLDKKLNFPERYPNYKPLIIKNVKVPIDDKYCKIISKSGKETIIDNHMYDKIKYHKIYISDYVHIVVDKRNLLLHRFLKDEYDPDYLIDHLDGDKKNNRMENLFRTDYSGNAQNRKKPKKDGQSEYMNVRISKKRRNGVLYYTFFDNPTLKYRKKHLTELHAARDRDLAILKHAPKSNFKMHFKDWNTGETDKWEKILKFEELLIKIRV